MFCGVGYITLTDVCTLVIQLPCTIGDSSSALSGGIMGMCVFHTEGSIEMSSTILETAVVTVTPTPGDSSALSGSIMAAIALLIVVSFVLVVMVVVVTVVAVLRKMSKAKQNARYSNNFTILYVR